MIPYSVVKVYDWFAIRAEICKRMNIDPNSFYGTRDPEEEYRNLWHQALKTIIPERMNNDTYVDMYYYEFDPEDTDVPKWAVPMIQHYNEIFLEILGVTEPTDDSIVVKFSW